MKKIICYTLLVLIFLACLYGVFTNRNFIMPNEAIGQLSNHEENLRFHKKVIRTLLYEYREYSAECFADSQLIDTHQIITGKEGQILPVYIIKWKWIHRIPKLSGFMQFLEKKYK